MSRNRDRNPSSPHARPTIWVAAFVVVILIAAIGVEGLAWGAYAAQSQLRQVYYWIAGPEALNLDPYEIPASGIPGHWRLKPGYNVSAEDYVAAKEQAGKTLSAAALRRIQDKAASPGRVTVNDQGYLGDPIDPEHRCLRILTVGDSVTFGMGTMTYPKFMQRALLENGLDVEVINGGVEGYAPRNAILELDRFLALEPEIVTIYIGWNAIFSIETERAIERFTFKTPWLISRVKRAIAQLTGTSREVAQQIYEREITYDPTENTDVTFDAESVSFTRQMRQLVDAFQESGAKVYLVTLFGLFQSDRRPSDRALKIGHLPQWTENSYVLSALTDVYNEFLRQLGARSGAGVIDMQSWGRDELRPTEKYFNDSVHLNVMGLRKTGQFLAEKLAEDISGRGASCRSGL